MAEPVCMIFAMVILIRVFSKRYHPIFINGFTTFMSLIAESIVGGNIQAGGNAIELKSRA